MTRRRVLVGAAAFGVAGSPRTMAQSTTPPRVGVSTLDIATYRAVVEGLTELGWRLGQTIEVVHGEGGPPLEALDKLIATGLDVLVAPGASRIVHALARTRLPIVTVDLETDPIESGFAASLSRPGGRVTGIWLDLPGMAAKIVELLRELVPEVSRASILWDGRVGRPQMDVTLSAAQRAGLAATAIALGDERDIGRLLDASLAADTQAVMVLGSPNIFFRRADIARAIAERRLPSISILTDYARAGGVMAYGPDLLGLFRRTAFYVDRILKGQSPGDLPIERPTAFQLILNRRAADDLGLSIAPLLLARADEVIE